MKLLLDECVVHDLKRDLTGHEVATVVEAGFGGLENGELLRAASGNFDVLITVDRNFPFQQNIRSLQIAVVILMAQGITYSDLKPLVPEVLASLSSIQLGELLRVEKSSKT
jgi:predicted nuclease of predicted toxin-antitoxin system